jgi:hypothetical protein
MPTDDHEQDCVTQLEALNLRMQADLARGWGIDTTRPGWLDEFDQRWAEAQIIRAAEDALIASPRLPTIDETVTAIRSLPERSRDA